MTFEDTVAPDQAFGRVVIVASHGGIAALTDVLGGISSDFEWPIAVVQHRGAIAGACDPLVRILARSTVLEVRLAVDGESADQRGVTVVPGHTMPTIDARGCWAFGRAVWNNRPGDALLESAAVLAPTIAVILTGMLADGAQGCRAVNRAGGRVIVQSPVTAAAASMPANAIATGCVDFVLALQDIGAALNGLTHLTARYVWHPQPLRPAVTMRTASQPGIAALLMRARPAAMPRLVSRA